jgi:2-dehydro-3-deoxygluconokinase
MVKDCTAGVRYYRDGSAASILAPEDLVGVPVESARAVLVTGVTALIGSEPQRAALSLLGASRGLRFVDPNLRTGLWGSSRRVELVLPLLDNCDVLLGGIDEMRELIGAADPGSLTRAAIARGPREVVVRARDRVYGQTADGESIDVEITRIPAVDPVGAGDAFNAGYIAVRLRGGSVEAAIRSGIYCGAAVTTAPSDTAAFPRTLK